MVHSHRGEQRTAGGERVDRLEEKSVGKNTQRRGAAPRRAARLYLALAVRLAAEEHGAAVVAQCAGDNLRSARAAAVDQHSQRGGERRGPAGRDGHFGGGAAARPEEER